MTFTNNAKLQYEVDADGPLFDADLVVVGGAVDVSGGVLQFVFTPVAYATFSPGKTFVIIRKDSAGAPTGPFASVPAQVPGSLAFTIDYSFSGTDERGVVGDGNDIAVTFTQVPEAGTFALIAAGSLMGWRRRRG